MKKIFFASALTVIISIGFTSCQKKCELCTQESELEIRICESDYDSNTEYGLALDVIEGSGYTCR